MSSKDQRGFSAGTVIMVLLLIAVIYFGAKFVARMNQDNKEQAKVLQGEFNGDNASDSNEGVETEEYEPPTTPKGKEYPITSVTMRVDSLAVELTATLPQKFSGTCTAELEQPDGSNYTRFVTELDHTNLCVITIPHAKLAAGKTWKHHFKFFTDNDQAYGSYPETTFTL